MRRARLTFAGAFHHVMNRGIGGENIFPDDAAKSAFLKILAESKKSLGVRVIGYCIMSNHYHLLLENQSGRMSELMKRVNGTYGIYFRHRFGGRGYLFQGRFKSTLIQGDSYMKMAILYLLQNPVRAGLSSTVAGYPWSSAAEIVKEVKQPITDVAFLHDLWGGDKTMIHEIVHHDQVSITIFKNKYGELLGGGEHMEKALARRERRVKERSSERRRQDDEYFEPIAKVYWELEKKYGRKFDRMDFVTFEEKRLRGELLMRLKELAGLTYRQIAQLHEFRDLKLQSLGKLYLDAKRRMMGSGRLEDKVTK